MAPNGRIDLVPTHAFTDVRIVCDRPQCHVGHSLANESVAYVVGDGRAPLSAWRLRRDVATLVPTTMVPSAFVAVERLPRTVRDKVDRAALPPPPPLVRPRPYREPRGDERDLAEIFATILGVDRVGLDDDFFELGGDSLAVMELLAAVADRFAVDLRTSAVLAAPTVAQLAKRLSSRREHDASPVVALRTGASGTPFFCVTGAGGPALSLRALSNAMEDWDFYAVQPRGLEEPARPDRTIAAAADRNVVAMRAVQPEGPYAIGGYSFGALIAFEIACRLRAAGDEVSLLVILDTSPSTETSPWSRIRARARAVTADVSARGLKRAAVVAARATKFAFMSAQARAGRRIDVVSAGRVPRRGHHQYDVFTRLNMHMARQYKPSAIFDGPILLVRCTNSNDHLPDAVESDVETVGRHSRVLVDLGWSNLVTGSITVAEVPGDHASLLWSPVVDHVGKCVSQALSSAFAQ